MLSAAAAIKPPVAAVVSLSAASTKTFNDTATVYAQPLDTDTAVTRLRMPVLYVVERHDAPFVADARKLYAHTPAAGKRLVVLPGYGHGTAMLAIEDQLGDLVLKFIENSTRG